MALMMTNREVDGASVLALGLGVTTFARNQDYSTVEKIWSDTVAKVPDNAWAHMNLGDA